MFYPGFQGAARVSSITQQASATSSTSSIVVPTVIAGDLILFMDLALTVSPPPSSAVSSGFTSIQDNSVDTGAIAGRQIISLKKADGTESGTSISGMTGSNYLKIIVTFRGDVAAKLITAFSPQGEGTTGNPTAQVVPSSGGAVPLVVIAAYFGDAGVNPRTFSPAKDGEVANGTPIWVAWKIYNVGSTPADVTVDQDDEGTRNILQSCYIQMS